MSKVWKTLSVLLRRPGSSLSGRPHRKQSYSVAVWIEPTSGRRVLSYHAGIEANLEEARALLAPPRANCTWRLAQLWDQRRRRFVDVIEGTGGVRK